jgi:hypothetical protein
VIISYSISCSQLCEGGNRKKIVAFKQIEFIPVAFGCMEMAAVDSDDKRLIDQAAAVAFRMARDAGAPFINRDWISNILGRTPRWVTNYWNKQLNELEMPDRAGAGRPQVLSQESRNVIVEARCFQRKGCRKMVGELFARRNKTVDHTTIWRNRRAVGEKPFHVISKPLKSETHKADRLWLAERVQEFDELDFRHFAFSDEFFVYAIRKANSKNDIVWALNPEDIPERERYRETVRKPVCIGIFIMFTALKMMWVIKERGESWDGAYFRQTILTDNVIPFLNDEDNVPVVGETTFVHDKAPCMRANATQELLRNAGIDFWGNDMWPGNSPDLNPTENIGEIIKDRVEARMHQEVGEGRYSEATLRANIDVILRELENDTDLFASLLDSMPDRFEAVRIARGGHTDY